MKNVKKALAFVTAFSMLAATACSAGNSSSGETNANDSGNVNGSGSDAGNGNTDTGVSDGTSGEYTYNEATSVFPTNWNPHTYQTNDDSIILGYCSAGFYTFDYNDTEDGYQIVPWTAVGEPEDVTADYAGQYGIEDGDTARAWKITIRDDIKWEDGTAITAQDWVTSAALLLNPEAQNYRADSLYQGNLAVVNARTYLYQGQHAYVNTMIDADYSDEAYIDPAEFETDDDGYFLVNGQDLALKLEDVLGVWDPTASLAEYYEYGYVSDELYTVLEDNADADGNVKVNQEIMDTLNEIVAVMHGYESADEYAEVAGDYAYIEWEEMVFYGEDYAAMDFSEVGIFAPADNELVIVLEKPLEGFYLLYALTDSWLVKEDLYKSCETVKDGVYTNTYGTSVDTFMSYGPYKLTTFQADKQYILEKNDQYFGFEDGQYQTTRIQVDYVDDPSTRLEMFLNGQLDVYGLSSEDMESYAASDYTYYLTGESTFFMALNPDLAQLTAGQEKLGDNYNKTILTVKEFRQALSFALDRASFALATAPTNNAAFGVFSSTIISNPDEGTAYRTTEQAKQVLADFWGLSDEIGDGKLYADLDEAVESITGYNLEQEKILFDEAYDKAIEEGLMDEDDTVMITIGVPTSSATFYSKGYDFLVNCYKDAVKGTKLEGKLEFSMDDTLGNAFSDALRSGQVDMLFGVGWTGSALDPYSLMEAYTSTEYQYDPCWDTTSEKLTISLTEGDYTATVWEWTEALSGTVIEIVDADGEITEFSAGSSDGVDEDRFLILAALEGAVLETYDLIPMLDDSAAQLKGQQINYYTEDYIYGLGFGGVQYYTYEYDDAEWADYVAEQGGTLNYK